MSRVMGSGWLVSGARWILGRMAGPDGHGIRGDLDEVYHESRPRRGCRADFTYLVEVIAALPMLMRRRRPRWDGGGPEGFWLDLRRAIRVLGHRPGVTLGAGLTLAVGLSVNAAIYSIVDGVLLRPLPFEGSDRLASLWAGDPVSGDRYLQIRFDHQERINGVSGIERTVVFDGSLTLLIDQAGDPERVPSSWWMEDPVAFLGVAPAMGRGFTDEELRRRDPVAVLSHELWVRRYGQDPEILGRSIQTDRGPVTVVGVAAPNSMWPRNARLYTTPAGEPDPQFSTSMLVRIAPDAEMESVTARLADLRLPGRSGFVNEQEGLVPWVEPLLEGVVGSARVPLLVMLGTAGLVLLLTAVNVTNLLLARGLQREGEFALQAAIGAGRFRLARQVILEGLILSALGLAVGGLLLVGGFQGLLRLIPPELPRIEGVTLNSRVVLVMGLVGVLAGLAASLTPALRAASVDPGAGLSSRGAGGGRGTSRLQSALMTTEIGLATSLVASAAVLLITLNNLFAIDPGFRPDVLTVRAMNVAAAERARSGADPRQAWEGILAQVRSLPDVTEAGVAAMHPMEPGFVINIDIAGQAAADGPPRTTMFYPVSDNYFNTVGMSLLEGRDIRRSDDESSPAIAVVNEAFVRRYLGGADALGAEVIKGSVGGPWGDQTLVEVVGVVADVPNRGLGQPPEPMMFVPMHQTRFGYLRLFVRSSTDPLAPLDAVREAIWRADPTTPLTDFSTLGQALRDSTAQQIFLSRILLAFALLGLSLALGGVYGVVSFAVGRRTREIGIRRAVGADSASVRRLIGRWALNRVAVGVAAGLGTVLVFGGALRGFVYGVSPADPLLLAGVAGLMGLAALAAVAVPIRRALRIDPLVALRDG